MQAVSETYNDKVVRQFAIATILWGIVGMAVGVLIAAQLYWPTIGEVIPWLVYGRLRREVPLGRPVDVVRREELDADLVAQARERGLTVVEGEGVEAFEVDAARREVVVGTSAGRALRARVLVGADGAGSRIRRAVLEVRHASWLVDEVFVRLARANVALCFHDWREQPVTGPITADFVYVRRHGTHRRYGGSYTDRMLADDARRIAQWRAQGKDVFVYFNNDGGAAAVRNATRLLELTAEQPGNRRVA